MVQQLQEEQQRRTVPSDCEAASFDAAATRPEVITLDDDAAEGAR